MERGSYSPANVCRLHSLLSSLNHDNIGRNGKERATFYPKATIPEIKPNPQLIIKPSNGKVEFVVYARVGEMTTSS